MQMPCYNRLLTVIARDEQEKTKRYAIEDHAPGEILTYTVKVDLLESGFPMGTFVYPHTAIVTPAPSAGSGGDWIGTDETGYTNYTSAKLNARVMSLDEDGKAWWARLGEQWITVTDHGSPDYGAPVEFPSARMAREQVERRREAERG